MVREVSGADFHAESHGPKAGYPNWPSDDAAVMKTALYSDTAKFRLADKRPVLAAIGFIDTDLPARRRLDGHEPDSRT
jgi:hypothetical protein